MSNLNDPLTSSSTVSIVIEQLLADGQTIKIKPQGYSMYPLFVPGRDEACIERTGVQLPSTWTHRAQKEPQAR